MKGGCENSSGSAIIIAVIVIIIIILIVCMIAAFAYNNSCNNSCNINCNKNNFGVNLGKIETYNSILGIIPGNYFQDIKNSSCTYGHCIIQKGVSTTKGNYIMANIIGCSDGFSICLEQSYLAGRSSIHTIGATSGSFQNAECIINGYIGNNRALIGGIYTSANHCTPLVFNRITTPNAPFVNEKYGYYNIA
jgi:hypothetical protein